MAQNLRFSQTDFECALYMAKAGLNKTSVCKPAGMRGFYWHEVEKPVISIYRTDDGKHVPVTAVGEEKAESDAIHVGAAGTLAAQVYYKDMANWKRIGLSDMAEFAEQFVTGSVISVQPGPVPA
jgi:hypothetical protein